MCMCDLRLLTWYSAMTYESYNISRGFPGKVLCIFISCAAVSVDHVISVIVPEEEKGTIVIIAGGNGCESCKNES